MDEEVGSSLHLETQTSWKWWPVVVGRRRRTASSHGLLPYARLGLPNATHVVVDGRVVPLTASWEAYHATEVAEKIEVDHHGAAVINLEVLENDTNGFRGSPWGADPAHAPALRLIQNAG